MNKLYTLLSFCLILTVFSCTGESEDKTLKTTDIIGTWECIGGSLDGEDGVLFARTDDTPGATIELKEELLNFELLADLNKSKQQPYSLEEGKIICSNDKSLVFEVQELKKEDGQMTLAFSAEGHNFVMQLERK